MQSSSTEFGTLVRQSHTACSKIEVTQGGSNAVVASTETNLEMIDATITIDRGADHRRSMSCSLSDSTGASVPDTIGFTNDWFDPVSLFEVRPYRGLILSSGTAEWMAQGVFYLEKVDIEETEEGAKLSCSLVDRSSIISVNPFQSPYNIAKDTNYATAIKDLITNRAVGFFKPIFNMEYTAALTPAMTFAEGDDPWNSVLKLAEGCGMEVFFGVYGELILRTVPDPSNFPVSVYFNETEDGVRVSPMTRSIDRGTAITGVIVRGSAPWLLTPVEGKVWDEDPLSATYRKGPLGELPEVITDAVVTNTTMAVAAAQARFNKVVGILEEITFSSVVDPRLDVGDIIELTNPRLSVSGRFILEKLDLPLRSDNVMGGTTRRRRRQ